MQPCALNRRRWPLTRVDLVNWALTGYSEKCLWQIQRAGAKLPQELRSRLCVCSCEGQRPDESGHWFRCVFD